jgi:4-hydroxy-3-polyprenylbenzoate decarboxylase
MPVAANLYGSLSRICLALGVEKLDELAAEIEELTTPPMPKGFMDALKLMPLVNRLSDLMPKTVKDAPCQEVVKMDGGLDELPILTCWPEDGGPFITLPLVITRDPETGMRNIGTYRMQIYDRRTTGMHWQRHKGGAQHHRVAERLGKRLEVAVALGADPVLQYSGDRSDAGRPRRTDARRHPVEASRRTREMPHGGPGSSRAGANRSRRLRGAGRTPPRRAVR